MTVGEGASLKVFDMIGQVGCFKAVHAGGETLLLKVEFSIDSFTLCQEVIVSIEDFVVVVDFCFKGPVDKFLDGFHEGEKGIARSMEKLEQPDRSGFGWSIEGIVGDCI
jgi:hypothetical protein